MRRTGLSIAGAVCLLLASIVTGLGGIIFAAAGHADSMMGMAEESFRQAEAQGNLTEEQKRQMADSREQMNKAMKELNEDPEKRQQLEKMRYYGYFEIVAALIGVIGGVGLLLANAFGKAAGLAGAVLGLLACVWGLIALGVGGIIIQGPFVIMYVVALMGALSLKPATAP
ncbi:MAG: hypothetical protein ACYTGB_07585 [Planctomycetota bacterium]|jgi:uncharacterized protein YlxW (UPF0749 family)